MGKLRLPVYKTELQKQKAKERQAIIAQRVDNRSTSKFGFCHYCGRSIAGLNACPWGGVSCRETPIDVLAKLRFKRLSPEAIAPAYANPGDAAMDFYAIKDVMLTDLPVLVETGIALEIPQGYFGSIRERSGLALKNIRVGGGVVDSGYRGEIKGIMSHLGRAGVEAAQFIKRGDRVFQLIVQPIVRPELVEVGKGEELGDTVRGSGGFGSTGK